MLAAGLKHERLQMIALPHGISREVVSRSAGFWLRCCGFLKGRWYGRGVSARFPSKLITTDLEVGWTGVVRVGPLAGAEAFRGGG